jgi:uncharacterized protein YndB with AHSA1/START domain
MSERSVRHATFAIERSYDASPARVFAAWATPAAKGMWFVGPDEWQKSNHELDFRVGGRERVSGGPKGGPVHAYDACYQDIVPNVRIILSYDMHLDDKRISVSLATIELKPAGAGTRLIYTEQGAFLDGYDDAALLDKLGGSLREPAKMLDDLDRSFRRGGRICIARVTSTTRDRAVVAHKAWLVVRTAIRSARMAAKPA